MLMIEFKERKIGLVLAIAFFLSGGAYVFWDAYIEGARTPYTFYELEGGIVALALLSLSAFLVVLGLYRLLLRQLRITLSGDVLEVVTENKHFQLGRSQIVNISRDGIHILVEYRNPEGQLRILPQQYRSGEDLYSALRSWLLDPNAR